MPTSPPPDDDDDELELEPIDPEVLAHDQKRGEARVETAVSRIDVDELYGDSPHSDLALDLGELKRFRFTTRHLLALTALLAIVLTMRQLLGGCNTTFVIGLVLVATGWLYVKFLERRQDAERELRRAEFQASLGKPPELAAVAGVAVSEAAATDDRPRFDVKFAFSLQELFITMTVAAVVMGLLYLLGPSRMSIILGLVALVGLVVQAAGFEAPRVVVLGWWMLLAMYLVVGLIAATNDDGKKTTMTPASELRTIVAGPDILFDVRPQHRCTSA